MNFQRSFFPLIFLSTLAACSAKGGGFGPGPVDTDASVMGDTMTADTTIIPPGACASLCARVNAAPGCGTAAATCMTECGNFALLTSCATEANALLGCANTSPITCSGATPNFTDCTAQLNALTTCAAMSPPPDASVGPDGTVGPDVTERPDSTVGPDVTERPDSTVGPDVPQGTGCESACARLSAMPACSAAASGCATQCSALSDIPPTCAPLVSAFFACANTTSSINCSGSGQPFTGCTSQYNSLLSCLGVAPPDSGVRDVPVPDVVRPDVPTTDPCMGFTTCDDCTGGPTCGWCGGRCYDGTSTGPRPPYSCSGQPWAWTGDMCP